MLAASVYIFVVHTFKIISPEWGYMIFIGVTIICIALEDKIYFLMASPPEPLTYSQDQPPFD